LLTNCQAQDISTYRFPLLRATSRRPADDPKERPDDPGNGRKIRGAALPRTGLLLTDVSNAWRAADIISRMAYP
jgi:hypothetical protein